MSIIEVLVSLGAFLVCLLLGAMVYERYIRRPDKLTQELTDAIKREKDRVKSQDHTTAGNGATRPD